MNRRFLAILAVGVLPWSVAVAGNVTFVFPLGLVDPNTGAITTIATYYLVRTTVLPPYLQAWGIGVLVYVGAVLSAAAGLVLGREDRRLTAGLLVVAGLTQITLAHGFSRQPGRFALPVGAVLLFAVVWWFDWPAVRAAVGLSSE